MPRDAEALQELSGETTFWLVGLNLDTLSGYTIWGGGDRDRFLTVDDRLVLTPTVTALLAGLPPAGRHPFEQDERFSRFCKQLNEIDLSDDSGGGDLGRFDFAATLVALREREVLYAPHSGMAIDCLGAAFDVGTQYGERSPGYQLARHGPLDTLYRVIWGEESEEQLDYLACEAALTQLVNWIETIAR